MLTEIMYPFTNIQKAVRRIEDSVAALDDALETLEGLPHVSGIIFGNLSETLKVIIKNMEVEQRYLATVEKNFNAIESSLPDIEINRRIIEIAVNGIEKLLLQTRKIHTFLAENFIAANKNAKAVKKNYRYLKKNFRLYSFVFRSCKGIDESAEIIRDCIKRIG
jgi:hypothetical protein